MSSNAIEVLKEDLMEMMSSLIDKFRQILSCIHEERIAIVRQDFTSLEQILLKRQELIKTVDPIVAKFLSALNTLAKGQTAELSLAEGLEWLNKNLSADNLDLLLYAGQLSVITLGIKQHTRSLLTALENQSVRSPQAQNYLVKISNKAVKTTLMIAEADQIDE